MDWGSVSRAAGWSLGPGTQFGPLDSAALKLALMPRPSSMSWGDSARAASLPSLLPPLPSGSIRGPGGVSQEESSWPEPGCALMQERGQFLLQSVLLAALFFPPLYICAHSLEFLENQNSQEPSPEPRMWEPEGMCKGAEWKCQGLLQDGEQSSRQAEPGAGATRAHARPSSVTKVTGQRCPAPGHTWTLTSEVAV